MISGTNQNRGPCAMMSESSCCSYCEGTASRPPAKGWQAEGRVCGRSYADEGSGRYVGRQALLPNQNYLFPRFTGDITRLQPGYNQVIKVTESYVFDA